MDDNAPLSPDMKWFIAETLLLYSIPAADSYVLHNNFVLTRAATPEAAVEIAERRGREWDDTFYNTDGHAVTGRFIGLRNLNEIYEELEDGAELLYEEFLPASEAEALQFVRAKDNFSVLRKPESD